MLLLLLAVLDLDHRGALQHVGGAVLRAMLASTVVLELLLEAEAIFRAFVLVDGGAPFAIFSSIQLLVLVSDLLQGAGLKPGQVNLLLVVGS